MKTKLTISLFAIVFSFVLAWPALADDPIIGEVRLYAGSGIGTPPENFLFCNGNGYDKDEYPALFNVIGYTYGGSGDVFYVPNFAGRFPVGPTRIQGQPFLAEGETGGEISHTLTITEIPSHKHNIYRTSSNFWASGSAIRGISQSSTGGINNNNETEYTGGGLPHNNLPPYMTVNFIIAYTTTLDTPTPTPTPSPTPTATPTPSGTPAASCAFPNTPILDDFNRADEGPPPGANWTDGNSDPLIVSGNKLMPQISGASSDAYWSTETTADSEVFFTLSDLPNDETAMSAYLRQSFPSPGTGYLVGIARDDTNGDFIFIGTPDYSESDYYPINLSVGDSFGLRAVGTTISAYYKPVGGSWSQVISVTDSQNTSAGYLYVSVSSGSIDNFGGGNYVCSETFLPDVSVYTYTLSSGKTLTVSADSNFGEVIIGLLMVSIVTVSILTMTFRVVYR